ncbi:MAG: peptidylprolyl isomerase [Myxococcota bacterium]|jgi:peptidyl-prolyl cis-trans isomerase B (cyclophilin B)|nr:peptidylprolyl isomerase [Myxococcota bacterium]
MKRAGSFDFTSTDFSASIARQARRPRFQVFATSLILLFFAASCEAADAPGTVASPTGKKGVEAIDEFIAGAPINKGDNDAWKQKLPTPPQVAFDASKTYYWMLETNFGSMKIELFPKTAPMHVSSTIYLTRLGFYDMVKFHRVIPGFMAQGGDPTGTGRGGPGYNYAGEFNEGAPKHDKLGTLSMANAGANTDGSQFFLTFRDTPHLNGRHTVFGRISDGVDVLKELEKLGSPGRGAPREEIHIKTATIVVE